MILDLVTILRTVHIGLGGAGLLLGAAALMLPKFTRKSSLHRWVGRSYAAAMLVMAATSLPLAIAETNIFLLVIGLLTLGWVSAGWIALRRARRASPGKRITASRRLRWHVIWMGSSYIAAWTAFLVNVQPIGSALPLMLVYSILPSIIGTFLIARTTARLVSASERRAGGASSGS